MILVSLIQPQPVWHFFDTVLLMFLKERTWTSPPFQITSVLDGTNCINQSKLKHEKTTRSCFYICIVVQIHLQQTICHIHFSAQTLKWFFKCGDFSPWNISEQQLCASTVQHSTSPDCSDGYLKATVPRNKARGWSKTLVATPKISQILKIVSF